jgi:signal transduction histidine kinase
MLDDFGLVPALEWQAREIAKRTGLHVLVSSEVADELPEEHKTCIFRVVQEALNNCAQHAQAKTARVSVCENAGSILVEVQDDGSGFDPDRMRGLGLLGMEERARHLGGTFAVDSRPGRGTNVRVMLPLASIPGKAAHASVAVAEPPSTHAGLVVFNGCRASGPDSHPIS